MFKALGNLTVGKKLFAGFGAVVLILFILSLITYLNSSRLQQSTKWDQHTYQVLMGLDLMKEQMINMETGQRGFALTGNENSLKPYNDGSEHFEKYFNQVKELTSDNPEQQKRLEKIMKVHEEWQKIAENSILLRRNVINGIGTMNDIVMDEQAAKGKALFDEFRNLIGECSNTESTLLEQRGKESVQLQEITRMTILLGSLIALLMAVATGILITRMITKPLKKTMHMLDELSRGHLNERLNLNTKDELGQMANAMDRFADELQNNVVATMNKISDGDVSVQSVINDDKDEITPALNKTIGTIRSLNDEVQKLIQAATEGKLDIRGDSSTYSGAWKSMIAGINGLIDAFVAPINMTAEYVERIGKGDIPDKITDTYLGDFNEIKNNINGCIDVMNGLLQETNLLVHAAQQGELDTRGNSAAFSGDWGNLIQGINSLVDAFVTPINMTAEYVDRISKGNIPDKITDPYYGDFNEIKNNINNCIDVMNRLLNGTNSLIGAAQQGQLDARADASQFTGEWGALMTGMNNLVDALVTPINWMSDYVDRISKGDIPEVITGAASGDFNKIKNNLNNCIDIMNGLLRETNGLIGAAQQGQLDARANLTGFTGSWEELISGVNNLVEAVVKPTKEVTSVMYEISEGKLDAVIKGDYKGEFGVLSSAVNNTAGYLKTVVGQISHIIGQISEGNIALDNIAAYKGDFISISNSMNTIIESLNSVLSDINTAADEVTSGSTQVSDGSQVLSQGTTEQASSIEELTASVSEVANKTKQNAENAGKANELTLAVKNNAELGNQHMSYMLQAMEEINESSGNISKIIKVIDDIAFQTNILALNAAVEAARAGQHGKGFAVVAEEVRTLAARSAEAAKETTELIQGSIKKAAAGTDIANNTAKALDEIVAGIAEAVDIIAEIAMSSNEQAMGISQINTGLNQVSQVVQTNAATAEESAASSEELSGQASMLKALVSRFNLRKTNGAIGSGLKLLDNRKTLPATSPRIVLNEMEYDKY